GIAQAALFELFDIDAHWRGEAIVRGAPAMDAIGDLFEHHPELAVLLHAEQRIDRRAAQRGDQPRARREGRRRAEEIHHPDAFRFVERDAVAGDDDPVPVVDLFLQLNQRRRADIVNLLDIDARSGVGEVEDLAEFGGVAGMDEDVDLAYAARRANRPQH